MWSVNPPSSLNFSKLARKAVGEPSSCKKEVKLEQDLAAPEDWGKLKGSSIADSSLVKSLDSLEVTNIKVRVQK